MMTRRDALRAALFGAASLAARRAPAAPPAETMPPKPMPVGPAPMPAPAGPYFLPPLPYAPSALEPHIDTLTMQIHHDKHHAAYVNNLNKALREAPITGNIPANVDDLIKNILASPDAKVTDPTFKAIRNQGGGHSNHSLFWVTMTPGGRSRPAGTLGRAIDREFGSFARFQSQFTEAAATIFGSGWAWLSMKHDGTLTLEALPNQDSPLMYGRYPLLGLDVWEHAYYLKHQNRRPEYIADWYPVVNWDVVADRFNTPHMS